MKLHEENEPLFITEEMAAGEPRGRDRLPTIREFIGDDVVVAHNTGFDIGVVRYACAADNMQWPEMQFLCTMVLARRSLSLPSYRLPFVVEALGKKIDLHHYQCALAARALTQCCQGPLGGCRHGVGLPMVEVAPEAAGHHAPAPPNGRTVTGARVPSPPGWFLVEAGGGNVTKK